MIGYSFVGQRVRQLEASQETCCMVMHKSIKFGHIDIRTVGHNNIVIFFVGIRAVNNTVSGSGRFVVFIEVDNVIDSFGDIMSETDFRFANLFMNEMALP